MKIYIGPTDSPIKVHRAMKDESGSFYLFVTFLVVGSWLFASWIQ